MDNETRGRRLWRGVSPIGMSGPWGLYLELPSFRGASHPEFSIGASSPFPCSAVCLVFLLALITKDLLASFGRFFVLQPNRINGLPTAIRRLYS